ncbi:hypothetical protein [Burkholderia cepacia]|uniref:hypothetical protein n=1 Tax=Burkholderia cepacia TaxID=292 RepID=UPI002AB799D0|nr:hypothetical protein [Burkholderia cepacia]
MFLFPNVLPGHVTPSPWRGRVARRHEVMPMTRHGTFCVTLRRAVRRRASRRSGHGRICATVWRHVIDAVRHVPRHMPPVDVEFDVRFKTCGGWQTTDRVTVRTPTFAAIDAARERMSGHA